jgi:MoxR-like ATPase
MPPAAPSSSPDRSLPSPTETAREVERLGRELKARVGSRIVGLDEVVEQVLIAVVSRNHVLLEGVPGLAKTLLLSTVAQLLDLSFSRIQFTPDLMPSDVTGSEYLIQDAETGQRGFRFAQGPIFANVVLTDEINRAPPKTQAALMEAMEEEQVTSLGLSRPLEAPFFVLATQNPIEQEGTYPLPAAQLDRFLFKVLLDYPTWDEEARIARMTVRLDDAPLTPVASKDDVLRVQEAVAAAPVPPSITRYAVELVQASRPSAPTAPPSIREYVEWGAGPRAAQALIVAGRARAMLRGRPFPDHEDLVAVAGAVLRHRLILSYAAEADGVGAETVTRILLDHVPRPGRRPKDMPWWRRMLIPLFGEPQRRSA